MWGLCGGTGGRLAAAGACLMPTRLTAGGQAGLLFSVQVCAAIALQRRCSSTAVALEWLCCSPQLGVAGPTSTASLVAAANQAPKRVHSRRSPNHPRRMPPAPIPSPTRSPPLLNHPAFPQRCGPKSFRTPPTSTAGSAARPATVKRQMSGRVGSYSTSCSQGPHPSGGRTRTLSSDSRELSGRQSALEGSTWSA